MNNEFKLADFVQVSYLAIDPDGITEERWRNALYTGSHGGKHSVIYANGEKHLLNDQIKIRKAIA